MCSNQDAPLWGHFLQQTSYWNRFMFGHLYLCFCKVWRDCFTPSCQTLFGIFVLLCFSYAIITSPVITSLKFTDSLRAKKKHVEIRSTYTLPTDIYIYLFLLFKIQHSLTKTKDFRSLTLLNGFYIIIILKFSLKRMEQIQHVWNLLMLMHGGTLDLTDACCAYGCRTRLMKVNTTEMKIREAWTTLSVMSTNMNSREFALCLHLFTQQFNGFILLF